MRKTFALLVLALLFFGAVEASAQGFVPGNIWYSKDPFSEGEKVKIYTLIFNPDERNMSGTVLFFNKTVLLGRKDFVVASGGVRDVSIDWTVTAGSHTIFGKIENARFVSANGTYEAAILTETETEESTRTVAKKIVTAPKEGAGESAEPTDAIENIKNIVSEKTPDFIAEGILGAVGTVESFREGLGAKTSAKKEEVKMNLAPLEESDGKIKKPLEYIKLFFFSLFSFIFNNKIVFYLLSAIIIFLILRAIWQKVF